MPKFYVTVEKLQSWNLIIEAENEARAQDLAVEETLFVEPDYDLGYEITHCSEVKPRGDDQNDGE